MIKKSIKFLIKINHYHRLNAIAEKLQVEPGDLVALWISQQIRKYEGVLNKKNNMKKGYKKI